MRAQTVLAQLAWTARAELSPMAAIFGGVVGQEAMKAVSGKFHPVHQWLYFDAVEALPEPALASGSLPAKVLAPPVVALLHAVSWACCIPGSSDGRALKGPCGR